MKDEGRLANDSVTVTVMSNIGFHKRAEELGIKVEVTAVGDRYVLENMKKTGCRIGRRTVRPHDIPGLQHNRRRYGRAASSCSMPISETERSFQSLQRR